MNTARRLCYRRGGVALCFKRGTRNLIYKKENENKSCTISVIYGKQSWVCTTYSAYHEIEYSTVGSGLVITSMETSIDSASYVVTPSGSNSFVLTVIASTNCAALEHETPGASCTVAASQQGVTPKVARGIALAPNIARTIYVEFNSSGTLTNIRSS